MFDGRIFFGGGCYVGVTRVVIIREVEIKDVGVGVRNDSSAIEDVS